MIEIDKLYLHELDKWCRNIGDQEAYFTVFGERVANQLEMTVSNDQRIITSINKLIKNYDYLEFTNKVQHLSQYKSRLKKIVRLLAYYQFISVKNCQDLIDKMEHFYLYDRFDSFIKTIQQAQKNQQGVLDAFQIERIWRNIIEKNFQEIWMFLASKKIYDPITMKLYEICQPCIKKYSIQKINEIKDYNEHNIKYLKETRQISPTIHDLFSAPNHSRHNHQYNQSINSYITEKSLFLNQTKMQMAFQLIKGIIACIKIGTSFGKTLTYELYGSIRTGFAIIQESDGDININPTKESQITRNQKVQYLSQIYQALRNDPLKKFHFSNIQVFTFEKIKVPFVKLKFQQGNKHDRSVLKHVDLIVSSPNGVENSKILQMYSKSQYIVKFCNLIKLWAKRKTLINAKMPIQGFSSYGIVLMAIFYLIKTDQAPFIIQTVNGYRLQKNLLNQKECKSLLQNFKGFLQFYKPNGTFFTEKMTVCLMSMPSISLYDKYLVNMYDFTDKSNPGRMPKNLSDKFFNYVNLASQMLLNQYDICQIMKQ